MSEKRMSVGQIRELIEIDDACFRQHGVGTGDEVQELIQRLTAGGVGTPDTTDPFLVQSKVLWNKGWGRELGFRKLDAYRKSLGEAGLPVKPERPAGMPAHLNRLVLWDCRPLLVKKDNHECVSIVKACRLLGVNFTGNDNTLIQHEGTPEITVPVRWVFCQDGWRHRDRSPGGCRTGFEASEVGLEALGGLFLFAQDPTAIGGEGDAWHAMDLPGSVHRDYPSLCACLQVWFDGPRLCWDWGGFALLRCGSASRWE